MIEPLDFQGADSQGRELRDLFVTSLRRAILRAVLSPAHNDLCSCDDCRERRMSQWRGDQRTPDGGWLIPRRFNCGDHLEFTRRSHSRNHVALEGTKCLYCHAR